MQWGLFLGILAGVIVVNYSNEKRKREYEAQKKRDAFKTELKLTEAPKIDKVIKPEDITVKTPKKKKKK